MALNSEALAALTAVPPEVAIPAAVAATAATASSQRRIFFGSLDEVSAIRYLQSFPTQALQLWSIVEWTRLGVPARLKFSAAPTEDGIRIVYYVEDEAAKARGAGGVVEDGGIELSVEMRSFPR